MTIKAVLFDADGVVIDSEVFSEKYVEEHDIRIVEMLPFFRGVFEKCTRGKADLLVEIKPWLSKWKWEGSGGEFLQYWFKAEHNIDERVLEAARNFKSKGIKCYMATNQEKYRTQYIKKEMGLEQEFDSIFSSSDIGYRKPEQEFFQFILDKLRQEQGILPYEILYFDDSKNNVETARKLGIQAHVYESFEDFERVVERNI